MIGSPLPASELQKYGVNVPGAVEVIWQPLYDYQTYAAAGTTSMQFFQIPIGQSSKTIHDTNMKAAGQLPQPQVFMVKAMEIVFYSGVTPATFGAQAAANYVNDVHAIAKSGHAQIFIGDKAQLDDAPIGAFPPSFGIAGFGAAADATTLGADQQTLIQYARPGGALYTLNNIVIPPNQNFSVNLTWPSVVATPSTVAGRIGVRLLGWLYRSAQ